MATTTENPAVGARVAMHWIDGAWVDSDEHRESVDPATGETIEVPGGDLHQQGGLGGSLLDTDQARAAVAAAG
jgi:hypothetical protein